MRWRSLLAWTLAATAWWPAAFAESGTDRDEPSAAAMACWIRGKATVWPAGAAAPQPLELLDRLEPGSVVETAAETEVTVIFFTGQRFAIGSDSRLTIESDDLKIEKGSARRLEPVTAVAHLPRLARSDNPGRRPAASRIRDTGADARSLELYPRDTAVVTDAALLSFRGVKGIESYWIEVWDAADEQVFAAATETTEVLLPADILAPGAAYYWRVSSLESGQRKIRGGAIFATLSAESARERQRLARQVAETESPGLRLVLAEVDYRLGLRRESCDALAKTAAETVPGTLTRVMAAFECPNRH